MPIEKINDAIVVETADHPVRTDSKEYLDSRKWLMDKTAGGCFVCDGPVDLSHPDAPGGSEGMQDHHGGGLYLDENGPFPVLIGISLFGLEWSFGYSADPVVVQNYVNQLNKIITLLGGQPYTNPITNTDEIMLWVDSKNNANIRLCAVHHIAHETAHTPDSKGHEAVGIHYCPFPIWLGQVTCEWSRFDMWGGSTGTIAVAPDGVKKSTVVMHVSANHPDKQLYQEHLDALKAGKPHVLSANHTHSMLAHAGSSGV